MVSPPPPEESSPHLLQVEGVYGQTFSLALGQCLTVEGPSGVGKTRLLRALADLDEAPGRVWLNGVERSSIPAPHWRIQVMYNAAEPVWWCDPVAAHMPDWTMAAPMVEALGLEATIGTSNPARLSTGERQRLALVRALVRQPKVLLLDEPTAALDAESAGRVEALLRQIRDQTGLALIWVSHDAAQRQRVADSRLELRR